ncbi:coiled-coil domain-containing protein 66 isoform 1 [Homo sapiens]|uniref:Coiled-coil domain-containing protein 66 n=3 Tax=Homo sapiens TaxID=9606 RepID=CCD66_HUMAN|nr:coiled-coil domain-containing protein 66 isoform 1 [Homo sapiens]A2RUB6.4 RecName: Full=Coiled-coil domain-containing protein 66 [Homo sapiens]|eukprot:NP_001135419.1 coiled-coil domain-containing protein 66 isoform 1 [Homo sapiens]
MNLGDGLKLETELLDGKTKLILSPYEHKSKISVKMGNKAKIAKCPLRTKTGHILKSTQDTCIGSEKLLQKKPVGSETSQAKGEKNGMTFSSTKDLCKQCIDKDCLHIQKEISPATPNMQKTRNTVNTSLVGKQKPHKKHITAENMKSSLVCLTQDQLQQILMTVNQGNRSLSLTENGKEAKSQYSLYLNSISNQPKDENIMGLFKKTEMVSSVPAENKSVLNEHQETSKQCEQKIAIENEWKPADIFSTLGERECDRSSLEAKKAQWRKELDEQVALKKKEKEVSEKWNDPWKKSESDKIIWEKHQILDQSRETVLLEHPFSAVKQELQRKWIEELNKQIEDDRQRKIEEKIIYSKGEEHDRWAMHFDSLKSYPGSQSQLFSQSTHKQPEYFCVSPDTQELADVSSVCTPTTGSQVEPSEEEHIAKPIKDVVMANSKKTNFLRSMTALLDPAQIEERDRRRQKQLEHQKAITAQVEEKRRKKQLEEEQRKKEEQEEELRLAQEREEMQKQYEEDILKQKQKEEIMTLKTNELFQTMQRAQELAQRLKQEQRIRELAQKGHDTSRLIKNLGVDTIQMEYNASNISNSRHDSDEISGKMNTYMNSTTSKKDTGVQTDDLNIGIFTNAESHCGSLMERDITNCSSPEISAELIGQFSTKKNKQELTQDKGASLEKENNRCNDQCNQFTRIEKQTKHMKKYPKRPDWNINKPPKRYIPASEKYPKQLQKQREEKKVRRQMELLHLVEKNNPGHLSQNRGISPEIFHSSHQETESKLRWHLVKKEEEPLNIHSFSKERSPSSPVPVVKNRTQQTQNTLHLPLKNSSYERENLISGSNQTELSSGISESSHFIPYVRTNEIYYLDPDAPLSGPSTQDPQYQNSQDCGQKRQLFDSDCVRDPLLNPNMVKNRDRQQAILKGLSELRQGLLQKQKELESSLLPLAENQEESFGSSF